ncbi:MAG: hypothetical protein NTV58_10800 [Deltaproteobacteria bacterium]|nr:hypothetical protein [Deltaproteobacteria bacterium]
MEERNEQGKKVAKVIAREWMLGLIIFVAVLFIGTVGMAPAMELDLNAGVTSDKYIKVTVGVNCAGFCPGGEKVYCLKGGTVYGMGGVDWLLYLVGLTRVSVEGLYWDGCTDRVDAYRGSSTVTWNATGGGWPWLAFRCDVSNDKQKVEMRCFQK